MVNFLGNIKHGKSHTLAYARWKSMMARCYQKNAASYKYYGAKCIEVCQEWHEFINFYNDMGEPESREMTLDRLDNSLGYSKNNCRWVSQSIQNKNRTHCVLITYMGKTQNITDWAIELGIRPRTLTMRISQLGWSIDKALSKPVKKRSVK